MFVELDGDSPAFFFCVCTEYTSQLSAERICVCARRRRTEGDIRSERNAANFNSVGPRTVLAGHCFVTIGFRIVMMSHADLGILCKNNFWWLKFAMNSCLISHSIIDYFLED